LGNDLIACIFWTLIPVYAAISCNANIGVIWSAHHASASSTLLPWAMGANNGVTGCDRHLEVQWLLDGYTDAKKPKSLCQNSIFSIYNELKNSRRSNSMPLWRSIARSPQKCLYIFHFL
jgi:hypothetical protein